MSDNPVGYSSREGGYSRSRWFGTGKFLSNLEPVVCLVSTYDWEQQTFVKLMSAFELTSWRCGGDVRLGVFPRIQQLFGLLQ